MIQQKSECKCNVDVNELKSRRLLGENDIQTRGIKGHHGPVLVHIHDGEEETELVRDVIRGLQEQISGEM